MRDIKKYTYFKMQIDELNSWFDDFLKCSSKKKGKGAHLDSEDIDNPLWKEYNDKYRQYMKIRAKMQDIEREAVRA